MENTQVATNNTPVSTTPTIPESYFDGKLIGLIGVRILTFIVTIITLGFAYPAMYCFNKRWIYKHTVINGYRLKFTGKGAQLIGKYLLWTFLTIITIGIYSFWLPIKYQKWETKHVEIDFAKSNTNK